MRYKIIFTEKAKKELKKLDKYVSALIIRMAGEKCRRM